MMGYEFPPEITKQPDTIHEICFSDIGNQAMPDNDSQEKGNKQRMFYHHLGLLSGAFPGHCTKRRNSGRGNNVWATRVPRAWGPREEKYTPSPYTCEGKSGPNPSLEYR